MPEIQDTNESINSRVEDKEPAGLPSAYTGQGWSEKPVNNPNITLEDIKEDAENNVKKLEQMTPTPKKRAVGKKVVQGKQSSVSDVVAKMEEKINMLRYIDGVSTGDIPATVKLSKEGREQLIQFQKDVEGLKQKYIISIQKQ